MRICFQIIALTILALASASHAAVHRIEAGEGTIGAALSLAAAGDTLLLVSSGGIYSDTKSLGIEIPNLTIMAAPNLPNPPILTTNRTKILEVYNTIKVAFCKMPSQPAGYHSGLC
jgi:hypothetical protein